MVYNYTRLYFARMRTIKRDIYSAVEKSIGEYKLKTHNNIENEGLYIANNVLVELFDRKKEK